MLTAVEGLAARRSVREIAGDIHGADADADWDPDSDVRAQVRRLVKKARLLTRGGYLVLAAGERPRLRVRLRVWIPIRAPTLDKNSRRAMVSVLPAPSRH